MAPRHGGGGGKLIQGLVLSAASIGGTLAVWSELHLEFDEVVLLVWTVVLPLWAIIALILPVLRKSADLRLYLFLLVVCPAVLLYFFSGHLTMDEAVLIALCVAPVVSTVRMVQSSLKRSLPDWNYHFWAERLPELFTLLCVGVLPVAACTEFHLMALDDAALLFFCVFAPIAFAILNSPALKAAREAVRPPPRTPPPAPPGAVTCPRGLARGALSPSTGSTAQPPMPPTWTCPSRHAAQLAQDPSFLARTHLVLGVVDALLVLALALLAPLYGGPAG